MGLIQQMTTGVCVFTSVRLLWRQAATCLCWRRLASAGSVVLQVLQNALGQQLDIFVGLWVSINLLQLLQAALLQQHAAVARGCRHTGHNIKSVSGLGR